MALISDGTAGSRLPTCDADLSAAQRAVLLTVLYADLFDYPLTEEELYDRLVLRWTDRATVRRSTASLADRYLTVSDGYVTWKGREHLADVRRRRSAASARIWTAAERYAAWLYRVPFVRTVAVSGSLAVNNAEAGGDVDLFCIIEAKRLWVARLFIVPMSKCTRFFHRLLPGYLCPNYLLTVDALEVQDRNLFTAHEIVQAVPLRGGPTHRHFLQSNAWVGKFLPHSPGAGRIADDPPCSFGRRALEALLRGRMGDLLDKLAHDAFCAFYRRRAVRAGWPWSRLEGAYQRNRYTVPEGGYVRVVRRLFEDRITTRLGSAVNRREFDRLFPLSTVSDAPKCYDWETLFHQEYGTGPEPEARRPIHSRVLS